MTRHDELERRRAEYMARLDELQRSYSKEAALKLAEFAEQANQDMGEFAESIGDWPAIDTESLQLMRATQEVEETQ